jgi:hypothetical protein
MKPFASLPTARLPSRSKRFGGWVRFSPGCRTSIALRPGDHPQSRDHYPNGLLRPAIRFGDLFELLPSRSDSPRSWTAQRSDIEARNYDLKAVNPNASTEEDTRTPEELLDLIEVKGLEVAEAIATLRRLVAAGG